MTHDTTHPVRRFLVSYHASIELVGMASLLMAWAITELVVQPAKDLTSAHQTHVHHLFTSAEVRDARHGLSFDIRAPSRPAALLGYRALSKEEWADSTRRGVWLSMVRNKIYTLWSGVQVLRMLHRLHRVPVQELADSLDSRVGRLERQIYLYRAAPSDGLHIGDVLRSDIDLSEAGSIALAMDTAFYEILRPALIAAERYAYLRIKWYGPLSVWFFGLGSVLLIAGRLGAKWREGNPVDAARAESGLSTPVPRKAFDKE